MDKKGKDLILRKTGLAKVSRQIEIVNKLLSNRKRQEVLEFLREHPAFFIELVSSWYPLNEELLDLNEFKWSWGYDGLGKNKPKTGPWFYDLREDTFNGLSKNILLRVLERLLCKHTLRNFYNVTPILAIFPFKLKAFKVMSFPFAEWVTNWSL